MDKTKFMEILQDGEQLSALGLTITLKLAGALAIFYVGKWAAEGVIKLIRMGMKRADVDETLRDFLANVLYGTLLTMIIVTALTQLGVETTSAAAVLGGAALAIGLSLQSQLSSLAAGVILIVFRPFKKGDTVEVGGTTGIVEEITMVNTRLRSGDNRALTIPNSMFTTQTIINHTGRPVRRVDLVIGISYESDLRKAKGLLLELVMADERALKQPGPSVEVAALGTHSVDLAVQVWTRTEHHGGLKAWLLEQIKLRFDTEGVVIPYPQMQVHLQNASPASRDQTQ